MSDTLRKDLIDLVWTKVETYIDARPALADRLLGENRERETQTGYLKRLLSDGNAPADFARASCVIEKMTHSAWTRAGSLAMDRRTEYASGTDEFPVIRTARVVFTLKCPLPSESDSETGADEEDALNLGDEVVNAIFAAGPSLGTSYIVSTGEPTVDERDTRADERPQPGKVYTVTFEITAQQMGRALLATINT